MQFKMKYTIIILFLFSSNSISQIPHSWPKNINNLKTSVCTVEYFQPQFEMGEIEDKSRIKRKITGILVDENGLVMTSDIIYPANLDIVESNLYYMSTQPMPEDITISFKRDQKLKARFIGKDEDLRIAFLRIENPDSLPSPILFESTGKYAIGDPIYIIQHLDGRFDFEKIITAHNINAIIEKPKKKLLTTTKIRPLSAGGLVVNAKGKAIGIVYRSENYYSHYDYEYEEPYNDRPLFQIIPAGQFKFLIMNPPELITQKEGGGKNWLGIQMQILTKEMAKYWGLGNTYGIIINKVIPGSPAEKAGLKSGDILISFDKLQFEGYDKKNADVLRNYVRNLPERNISAQILRDKKRKTINIKLESAPKSRFLAEEYSDEILGIGVKELTQDFIINNDLDFDTEGVWVSRVEDAGAASLGGIDVNDLVIQINDHDVKNLEDFEKFTNNLLNSKSDYIQVFLKRQGSTRFVFIKLIKDEDKKM